MTANVTGVLPGTRDTIHASSSVKSWKTMSGNIASALDQGHAGQQLDLQTLVVSAVERSLELAGGG